MQITHEQMKKALIEALEKQSDGSGATPFVGQPDDDSDLILDGWFNIDDLTRDVLEGLK